MIIYPKRNNRKLLNKIKQSFDDTLGDMNVSLVHLEVKEGDQPKYHKPFPISKIHEMTLENLRKGLCKIGVLNNVVILCGLCPIYYSKE